MLPARLMFASAPCVAEPVMHLLGPPEAKRPFTSTPSKPQSLRDYLNLQGGLVRDSVHEKAVLS